MNNKLTIFSISILCMLSGCTPLQQAPLVYSSKVVVGVDVSMSVAENQGGAVSLGVKTIDSAYVPVAVSKQLDEKSSGSANTMGIERIEAKYGEGTSSSKQDEASTAEQNRKIDAYLDAKQAAVNAADALSAAEKNVSSSNSLISRIETLRSALVSAQNLTDTPPNSQRTTEFTKRAAEIGKINSDANLNFSQLLPATDGSFDPDKNIKELDAWMVEARKSKSAAELRLPELKAEWQAKSEKAIQTKAEALRVVGLSQTSKTDAMSVYGRFDGNATGTAKEGSGSILVGKVFSTGLASQNLTEAVKIEARSHCIANGFELAKNISVEADRKIFLASLEKLCAGQNGNGS